MYRGNASSTVLLCVLPHTYFHQELRETRRILEVREQKLMDLSQANANLNADNDGLRRCATSQIAKLLILLI